MTGPLKSYYEAIGAELGMWRKTCQLSQTQVAKRLGLLQGQVSQIEMGALRQPADRLFAYVGLLCAISPTATSPACGLASHRKILTLIAKPPTVGEQTELPQ